LAALEKEMQKRASNS